MVTNSRVDSQGRLLIPVEIRRKVGIQPDSEVKMTLVGNQLVISPVNHDLQEQVERWKKDLLEMHPPVGSVTPHDEGARWMDEEYVRRKMGLS
ncbi:MAG: AbrB/MazE/SpoVT family DNA-binding domain-containing protein [Promethearchaeota archaeon]